MKNFGISLGIYLPALTTINIIVLLFLGGWWVKTRNPGILLIIVGGLLNLGERLRWGYVNDYWKIPFVPLYNNINDWLIFIGVGWCIWWMWQKK